MICDTIVRRIINSETLPGSPKNAKLFPNGIFGNNVFVHPCCNLHYIKFATHAIRNACNLQQVQFASCAICNMWNFQHLQFAKHIPCNTLWQLQDKSGRLVSCMEHLDGSAGRTSLTDQLHGPAGWTNLTDQLDGPILFTWSLGQFAYLFWLIVSDSPRFGFWGLEEAALNPKKSSDVSKFFYFQIKTKK